LSPDERKARVDEVLRAYYRDLGACLLKGHDREFWRYHRGKLEGLGFPFSKMRVAAGALSVILDILLNPKSSVERALAPRAERKPASSRPQRLVARLSKLL
jgi:hypothetical protein